MATRKNKPNDSAASVGYEAQLWQMADMDAAEYQHVCIGLLFLKYISDAFEVKHAALVAEKAQGADPEDPDEYRALCIFWVPPEARWPHLKAQACQATVGQLVDDAMAGIERVNPALKGVLPKDHARPALDKQRLGQLIDMISNIKVGDEAGRAMDVLGRVYEYFLSQFASAEGKEGGEKSLVQCKQWRAFKFGVDVVRELYGVMAARGATSGFVVTSGRFADEAVSCASGCNVNLVHGLKLHGLIRQARVGADRSPARVAAAPAVQTGAAPMLASSRLLSSRPMARRTTERGTNAGGDFWGCTGYPACRGTRPIA